MQLDEEADFEIKECKTKSSFVAKPKKRISLNIKKITKKFEVIEDAGIIAVIRIDNEEIVVNNYGELIFKTNKDIEKIRKIAKEIYTTGKT